MKSMKQQVEEQNQSLSANFMSSMSIQGFSSDPADIIRIERSSRFNVDGPAAKESKIIKYSEPIKSEIKSRSEDYLRS